MRCPHCKDTFSLLRAILDHLTHCHYIHQCQRCGDVFAFLQRRGTVQAYHCRKCCYAGSKDILARTDQVRKAWPWEARRGWEEQEEADQCQDE